MRPFLSLILVAKMSFLVLQLVQISGIFLQFWSESEYTATVTFW